MLIPLVSNTERVSEEKAIRNQGRELDKGLEQ
jgi:hypothetical protein